MIRTRVGKINNNNGIYLIFACVIFSIFLSIRQMHLLLYYQVAYASMTFHNAYNSKDMIK